MRGVRDMSKVGSIILIWVVISMVYIIIAILMPFIQSVASSTANTINASSNMSNYPGTLETVQSFPLAAWFIPGVLGIGATVWMLKRED